MRRWTIGLVALALLATPGLAEEPTEPEEIVRATVDRVNEILSREGLSDDQRVQEIEKVTYDRFDFPTISRLVVINSWKKFSLEQREEFVTQFKLLLSNRYGSKITRYEQQKLAVLGHRAEKNGDVTVQTQIKGGSAKGIEVDYRLRREGKKRDGPWLVIDVIIDGLSLVRSYRAQYEDVLGDGGPEELIEQLRKQNAEKATVAS